LRADECAADIQAFELGGTRNDDDSFEKEVHLENSPPFENCHQV
jgi:hypothetical protein